MKHKIILYLTIIMIAILSDSAQAYQKMEFVSEFGGKGEALGKFSEKTRITFDKNGNIYILDQDNLCIQKLDQEGKPVLEIKPSEDFLFINPKDIAVDSNLNIYVVDWKSVHVEGTESPKVFNYGICVHKFSEKGKFIASYTLENLAKKPVEKERAVPAIDTDGNFALLVVQPNRDRKLYVFADTEGNIFVLDQNRIHKLNPSGEPLMVFGEGGDGSGQLDDPAGMAIDTKGNIYVADSGNNRISKFNTEGKFILSFGKQGDKDGFFTGTMSVVLASDGTILVADSAKYEKVLKTQLQQRNITDSTILVTGQDDPIIPKNREFLTVMRRFQRFDENGKFIEKILYTVDKNDPELKDLEFKAIDPYANLYLIDKNRLVIRKYKIQKVFQWSSLDKVFTYRFLHHESRNQLDNPYDLNIYYDFDERLSYNQMLGIMRLDYDITEAFHVALSSYLSRVNGKTTNKYPGEYSDPYGYIQDDVTTDKYTAAKLRLDMSLILEQDPFNYRESNLFVYFGGGRYDYNIDATDINNERRLDEKLWSSVWAAGVSYDIGNSMRLSFTASQHRPMDYMNFDYIYYDEEGTLYSTGSGKGTSTQVFITIEGAF
jgi:DNA-binding beta-propeller fold protein YncE